MLKFNNLKLEGNYNKVISFDVYKGIVNEKKKIEKNYREEIFDLLKEIKQKEKKLESLNKEIKEISELYEKKKNIFYDNDDIAKVIKREAENLDIKQDFQKKTLMKGKIQYLDNIVKKSKDEFSNKNNNLGISTNNSTDNDYFPDPNILLPKKKIFHNKNKLNKKINNIKIKKNTNFYKNDSSINNIINLNENEMEEEPKDEKINNSSNTKSQKENSGFQEQVLTYLTSTKERIIDLTFVSGYKGYFKLRFLKWRQQQKQKKKKCKKEEKDLEYLIQQKNLKRE